MQLQLQKDLRERELQFKFSEGNHLVDSETVLNMINKLSTRSKVYEGVRIGEIQQATGGVLSDWHWISGNCNISDWVTRGKVADDLGPQSEWWCGPNFLHTPISEWRVKGPTSSTGSLPREKQSEKAITLFVTGQRADFHYDFSEFSSAARFVSIVARLLGVLQHK